jgi:lysophospholipid acyltransferase (LPLAT)-like uncharacterized protein
MAVSKRLMALAPVQAAAAFLLAGYIRLVHATSRWEHVDYHHIADLRAQAKPFLACFWHGRIMMLCFLWREPEPFRVLVSPHRDGRLIGRVMRRLNCDTIDGSTTRNATAALRSIIARLRRGECIGITPDGPRGPRQRAKAGVAAAARAAGVPIIPIAFSTSRARTMSSWDRFMLALPFGRGVFVVGTPIDPTDMDLEELRVLIETRLNETTDHADRLAGIGAA